MEEPYGNNGAFARKKCETKQTKNMKIINQNKNRALSDITSPATPGCRRWRGGGGTFNIFRFAAPCEERGSKFLLPRLSGKNGHLLRPTHPPP